MAQPRAADVIALRPRSTRATPHRMSPRHPAVIGAADRLGLTPEQWIAEAAGGDPLHWDGRPSPSPSPSPSLAPTRGRHLTLVR